MKNKNLEQWLAHIESFHPSDIELGLDRIKKVASLLGLIEFPEKVVLIGGTNGKGSCVAMLESLALHSGKQVASYTSPHLIKFNERIRINGVNIDDDALVAAFEKIEQARGNVALTFFEFTTLAALLVFQYCQLDLIILEVGLGGRQDATNIIEPDVSVITTVDRDHIDWLGDELEKIAYEKGGIIRPQKIALVGDVRTDSLLRKVLPEYCEELILVKQADSYLLQQFASQETNPYCLIEQNLMLASMAYESCFGKELKNEEIVDALKQISLQGRFQRLSQFPVTIVDVAHNPQSAKNLLLQLDRYVEQHNISRVTAICGMMADKAIEEVLEVLLARISHWCFVDLDVNRAIRANELEKCYKKLVVDKRSNIDASSLCFDTLENGYQWVVSNQSKSVPDQEKELILVFGSFITVAKMLQYHQQKS